MNDAANPLAALRDIHLPPDPVFWPPAPGWWIVAVSALLVGWLVIIAWRKYRRKLQPAREFRRQLMALDIDSSNLQRRTAAQEISVLVRQFAICRFGRDRVARLYGDNWLEFLNSTTKNEPEFTTGVGKILKDAPYRSKIDFDLENLRSYLLRWSREV